MHWQRACSDCNPSVRTLTSRASAIYCKIHCISVDRQVWSGCDLSPASLPCWLVLLTFGSHCIFSLGAYLIALLEKLENDTEDFWNICSINNNLKKKRSTSVLDCKLPVENDLVKILQISAVVDISINFSFLEHIKETLLQNRYLAETNGTNLAGTKRGLDFFFV